MDKLDPRSQEALTAYQQKNRPGRTSCPTLREQVVYGKNWTTPQKHDSCESTRVTTAYNTVTREVRNWSTPIKTDSKFCLTTGKFTNIVSQVQELSNGSPSNRLNPAWCELLMGWPIGWSSTSACARTFPGFPKGQGDEQHDYEAPRTIHKDQCINRPKRIAMIGNGVVPQQVALAFTALMAPDGKQTE
ncbi:hypothetical protein ACFQBQ_00805 [Granulicella cerasi]|uniref:DNA (cytosine-5-)-methyltransferase n=1 Tax=Granulicella cerasi TaxID=741063 RepID=A0ABW1Z6R2_9BACT